MSKEAGNNSFNERPGSTGNSGMLGLSNLKPKLQPIRIKAFLEMYTSDEEDSEDRDKDSSESEDEDIQPLPNDEEENPDERRLTSVLEETEFTRSTSYPSSSTRHCTLSINDQTVETSNVVRNYETDKTLFRKLEQNVSQSEHSQERNQTLTIYCESMASVAHHEHENSKSMIEENRRSNVQLEVPTSSENLTMCTTSESGIILTNESSSMEVKMEETLQTMTKAPLINEEKLECTLSRSVRHNFLPNEHSQGRNGVITVSKDERCKSEIFISESQCSNSKREGLESSTENSSHPFKGESIFPSQEKVSARKKFDSVYFTKERHHSAPEAHSYSCETHPSGQRNNSHLVNDTPMKNNPPAGSMRPTPSTSHRSIFQTPRNSKLHQDYSKNHDQTPATIFGNWSQNHMAHTPLQSCESCDTIPRSQAPSTVSQTLSSHDVPLFRNVEEKRTRRPLVETLQSSQANQHSHNKKLSALRNREIFSSFESFENHSRLVLEHGSEKRFNKSETQETKENRHPQEIEKPLHGEESSFQATSESKKETIVTNSNEIHNENDAESRISNCPTYEQHASSIRVVSSVPQDLRSPTSEKKNIPERQNNVQVSVPSRMRRPNHSQTITVKDKEYLILDILGEGMSGQVFRVQELDTLSLRAIKVVDLSRLDKDCAQGCLQEITMLSKLQAPSVVKMFDHEIKYPIVHVVMEMGDTDLKSLLNVMSAQKRLPLTMILYYWTEMLTAVKHIHDNGVIHSDLKPANFLLVRGRLKLIDFGIASSMNADMTSVVKNNPIGTLNYISPEALMDISGNNEDSPTRNVKYKISFKSDVWSLGCILYSLVYGYTPFHNIRTQWAKLSAITNPNPKISFAPPTGPDVEPTPPILIDVMRKCLRHEPKARPTVDQLLQIPYIPIKPIARNPPRQIPSNILMKIKYSVTESEWRQLTEILEDRGNL